MQARPNTATAVPAVAVVPSRVLIATPTITPVGQEQVVEALVEHDRAYDLGMLWRHDAEAPVHLRPDERDAFHVEEDDVEGGGDHCETLSDCWHERVPLLSTGELARSVGPGRREARLSTTRRGPHTSSMSHHGTEIDWVALAPALERGAEVHAPLYVDAIRWLAAEARRGGDPEARLVIDVGAGPGVITGVLADVFRAARVIAVDGTPELLDRAADRAARAGFGDRVETRVADLPDGLDDLGDLVSTADVVWASAVLHHVGDQQHAIRRVAGLLRPGGLLGLAEGGLPTRTLPRDIGLGSPGLEARLDAANESWFADMRADLPGATPAVEHWPGLLASAGLVPLRSRTFLLDLPAPLADPAREMVRRRLERSREMLAGRLDADDVSTLDQLLDHDSDARR